jgi:hypothetical protein
MSALMRSILLLSLTLVHTQPQDRCGDCWCIFTGELDACPTDPVGIADSYDSSYQVYETFQLTNTPDFLKLQGPSNGEPCYPFKDTLGPRDRYAESNLPQCVIQETGGVCAYKYQENQLCNERDYEIITYDSSEAAEADGAAITHSGGEFLEQ